MYEEKMRAEEKKWNTKLNCLAEMYSIYKTFKQLAEMQLSKGKQAANKAVRLSVEHRWDDDMETLLIDRVYWEIAYVKDYHDTTIGFFYPGEEEGFMLALEFAYRDALKIISERIEKERTKYDHVFKD